MQSDLEELGGAELSLIYLNICKKNYWKEVSILSLTNISVSFIARFIQYHVCYSSISSDYNGEQGQILV